MLPVCSYWAGVHMSANSGSGATGMAWLLELLVPHTYLMWGWFLL
jgi:hypothetical protein